MHIMHKSPSHTISEVWWKTGNEASHQIVWCEHKLLIGLIPWTIERSKLLDIPCLLAQYQCLSAIKTEEHYEGLVLTLTSPGDSHVTVWLGSQDHFSYLFACKSLHEEREGGDISEGLVYFFLLLTAKGGEEGEGPVSRYHISRKMSVFAQESLGTNCFSETFENSLA